MPSPFRIVVLLCGIAFWGIFANAAATPQHKSKIAVAQAAPVQAPLQQLAPTPAVAAPIVPVPQPQAATPEHSPATPPHVTMSGGLLSITAENSTLGDVLSAVKSLTGAGLDVPMAANAERVVVKLGPARPQEVLEQLFTGSKFDYIILGSPDGSGTIQKIILTARTNGTGTAVASQNGPGGQPSQRAGFQPPPPPDDSGVDDEIVQPEPPTAQNEEVVTPPAGDQQDRMIGPGGQAQANQQNQNQTGPKTPEQLLQELQRLQQQQGQQGQTTQPNPPARPQ